MAKVHLLTDRKTLEVEPGTPLVRAIATTPHSILFGCRDGACGSCLIRVAEHRENCSPASEREKRLLSSIAANHDERLACQVVVQGDLSFEVAE